MPLSRILTACLHFQFLKDQKQFYWLKIYQVQYIIILNRLHHVTYRYSRNNVSGNVHKNIIQHPHSRYKAETQAVQTSSVNNHYSIITKISDHKYLEVKNNYNNYDCLRLCTIIRVYLRSIMISWFSQIHMKVWDFIFTLKINFTMYLIELPTTVNCPNQIEINV